MSDAPIPNLSPPPDDEESLLGDTSEFERKVLEEFRPPSADAQAAEAAESATEDTPPATGDEAPSPTSPGVGEPPPSDAPSPSEGGEDDETLPPAAVDDTAEEQVSIWAEYAEPDAVQQEAKQLVEWYSKLDPNAVQTIDAALSGEYVLVPVDQVATLQENWDKLQSGEYQQTPQTVDSYEPDDGGPDPQTSTEMEAMRRQIAQMQEQQMRANIDQQVASTAEAITVAEAEWRDSHPELTAADINAVQEYVLKNGTFGPLARTHGDAEGIKLALEQATAVVPSVRQRILDAEVSARTQQELDAMAAQQANGQRASAISGASSAPPDLSGMDPEEAMVAEIRQSMGLS